MFDSKERLNPANGNTEKYYYETQRAARSFDGMSSPSPAFGKGRRERNSNIRDWIIRAVKRKSKNKIYIHHIYTKYILYTIKKRSNNMIFCLVIEREQTPPIRFGEHTQTTTTGPRIWRCKMGARKRNAHFVLLFIFYDLNSQIDFCLFDGHLEKWIAGCCFYDLFFWFVVVVVAVIISIAYCFFFSLFVCKYKFNVNKMGRICGAGVLILPFSLDKHLNAFIFRQGRLWLLKMEFKYINIK